MSNKTPVQVTDVEYDGGRASWNYHGHGVMRGRASGTHENISGEIIEGPNGFFGQKFELQADANGCGKLRIL